MNPSILKTGVWPLQVGDSDPVAVLYKERTNATAMRTSE